MENYPMIHDLISMILSSFSLLLYTITMKTLLIVLPAYNEAKIIFASLELLEKYLQESLPELSYAIVVSDNNSSDTTQHEVEAYMTKSPHVSYYFTPQQGKGVAIKKAWLAHAQGFEYAMFMDADLAVSLDVIPRTLSSLKDHQVAIANRYDTSAITKRTPLRSLASYIYRGLVRKILKSNIQDLPCGCKAFHSSVLLNVLPQTKNNHWFFDSELIYLLEQSGAKIAQLPVTWKDRDDKNGSKVSVIKVGAEYLREILRLKIK